MKIIETIDTTPDASLMEDIGVGNFTVAEAIAELVANSFDWRYPDAPLQIEIEVSASEILIRDSGVGMNREVLSNAVVLSRKTDSVTKRTKARKGMFGLGMKTACANLGKHWTVLTRTDSSGETIGVSYDLVAWRSNAGNSNFKWQSDLFSLESTDEDNLASIGHGTEIRILKLRDKNPSVGAIGALLARAYKGHLESGDRIVINGEVLVPPAYNLVPDSRIDIALELKDSDGTILLNKSGQPCVITGWAALDHKTHNDDAFGFNLYREGQLVEQWNKSFFRVHLMTSRLIGEINLDFVSSNFHKKGFDEDSEEWKEAVKALTVFLRPLAKASGEMARGRGDNTRQERALEGLQKAMGNAPIIESGYAVPDGNFPTQVDGTNEAVTPGHEAPEVTAASITLNGELIRLGYEITEADQDSFIWDYIFDSEASELQAVINSRSNLYTSVKDPHFLAVIALADSVMRFLVTERSLDFTAAAEIRDSWISKSIPGASNG